MTENLNIQINENIIKKLRGLGFQADQWGSVLFVLFGLYENRLDLLDHFDDFNGERRAVVLYKEMEMRGLLDAQIGGEEAIFGLSAKGIETVEYIRAEFDKTEPVNAEKIAVYGIETPVSEWINEWLDIFPRGVRSGGRLLRDDKQSCLRKMEVFIKEYPEYSKETIMEATKKYIEAKAQENYAFTRCAVYFIYRVEKSKADKVSDLAAWCEQVEYEKKNPTSKDNNTEIMV